jgi:hypothetical protein
VVDDAQDDALVEDDAVVEDADLASDSLADFPAPIEVVLMKFLVPDITVFLIVSGSTRKLGILFR